MAGLMPGQMAIREDSKAGRLSVTSPLVTGQFTNFSMKPADIPKDWFESERGLKSRLKDLQVQVRKSMPNLSMQLTDEGRRLESFQLEHLVPDTWIPIGNIARVIIKLGVDTELVRQASKKSLAAQLELFDDIEGWDRLNAGAKSEHFLPALRSFVELDEAYLMPDALHEIADGHLTMIDIIFLHDVLKRDINTWGSTRASSQHVKKMLTPYLVTGTAFARLAHDKGTIYTPQWGQIAAEFRTFKAAKNPEELMTNILANIQDVIESPTAGATSSQTLRTPARRERDLEEDHEEDVARFSSQSRFAR